MQVSVRILRDGVGNDHGDFTSFLLGRFIDYFILALQILYSCNTWTPQFYLVWRVEMNNLNFLAFWGKNLIINEIFYYFI